MGNQNTGLPNIKLVAYDNKGTICDVQSGRFGHNALWRRQNEMLNGVNAYHVRIYRIAERDGE